MGPEKMLSVEVVVDVELYNCSRFKDQQMSPQNLLGDILSVSLHIPGVYKLHTLSISQLLSQLQ